MSNHRFSDECLENELRFYGPGHDGSDVTIDPDSFCEILLDLRDARARLALVEPLLHEVAVSGVEFEDERVGYVTVQIDRETWAEIRATEQHEGEEVKP